MDKLIQFISNQKNIFAIMGNHEYIFSQYVKNILETSSLNNPEDIVKAFESNNQNTMNALYNESKRLVELRELYKELCYEFYQNKEEK